MGNRLSAYMDDYDCAMLATRGVPTPFHDWYASLGLGPESGVIFLAKAITRFKTINAFSLTVVNGILYIAPYDKYQFNPRCLLTAYQRRKKEQALAPVSADITSREIKKAVNRHRRRHAL